MLIGIPGAIAIIGLIELSTGRAFQELEKAWATFQWWKKALFGSIIVIVGGTVAFVVVALVVK